MTWTLFGKEKREAAEREARATMKALDEQVNGPAKKLWGIDVHCASCKLRMTQDPANTVRWICSGCRGVLKIGVELAPEFMKGV